MESQNVYINSKDRISGNPSQFQINIKDIDNDFNIGLQIQKINIPYSYYPINSLNNVINYDFLNITGISVNDNITLDQGFYDVNEFITNLLPNKRKLYWNYNVL